MSNTRKHSTTTVAELRAHFAAGLTVRETAARLGLSLSGLRQACALLEDLRHDVVTDLGRPAVQLHASRRARTRAHNPFGLRNSS